MVRKTSICVLERLVFPPLAFVLCIVCLFSCVCASMSYMIEKMLCQSADRGKARPGQEQTRLLFRAHARMVLLFSRRVAFESARRSPSTCTTPSSSTSSCECRIPWPSICTTPSGTPCIGESSATTPGKRTRSVRRKRGKEGGSDPCFSWFSPLSRVFACVFGDAVIRAVLCWNVAAREKTRC